MGQTNNKKYNITIKCKNEELKKLFCSCSDLLQSSIDGNIISYKEVEMFMPLIVLGYEEGICTKTNSTVDNNFEVIMGCEDENTSEALYNLSYKLLSSCSDYANSKILLSHNNNKVFITIKSNSDYFPRFIFSFK